MGSPHKGLPIYSVDYAIFLALHAFPRQGCSSVELRACRDMIVYHQKMQPFPTLLMVYGAYQHAAGVDAHHGPGGQVGYCYAGLAHQLFRLIVLMDAAEDDPVGTAAVVQSELQELLALLHGLAGFHLHRPEVGLAEGVEVHEVCKEGLYLHLGKVDGLILYLYPDLGLRTADNAGLCGLRDIPVRGLPSWWGRFRTSFQFLL